MDPNQRGTVQGQTVQGMAQGMVHGILSRVAQAKAAMAGTPVHTLLVRRDDGGTGFTVSAMSTGSVTGGFTRSRIASACREVEASIFTASIGYLPIAASPDSITASVPSNTALATSFTSARVGTAFLIMLSNICVAVITKKSGPLAFAWG